ncbi:MAG: beta-galactosidase [Puniceicoccaceae bacterium]|nr:MAG: beta-galactosidase [Puniceicoccaceae bacterium]
MIHHLSPEQSHECSLNGLWQFTFLADTNPDVSLEEVSHVWEQVLVPSAFDASIAYAGKRGVALYRREIEVPVGSGAELFFGAVSMWSRIYVDGQLLLENACGFEPLRVRVPASDQPRRLLTVVVDNRFDFDRIPMHEHYFDFYQYGGILRDVRLRILPEHGNWISAVRVTPMEHYREGIVQVDVDVVTELRLEVFQLNAVFDGAAEVNCADCEAREGGFRLKLQVPHPEVWSPDSPRLHQLKISLRQGGQTLDSRSAQFGLRRIEAREGQLWLNGEKLILKGYNRHEWHPNGGPCTPVSQMMADIQILKDLGCNFVRGSHYHQDQKFLDLCDAMGLMVWEENLGWGQREKTFASKKFVTDHEKGLRSMVAESYNHPSIIMWGFLNEAGTNAEYVRPVVEASTSLLRELDPSRLVTFASMFIMDDKYLDLVDVISINCYPGWYGCEDHPEPLSLIEPAIEKFTASVDARGFGDKPILISEIGAEGLYGWRDPHNDFFTETYQTRYLQSAIEATLGNHRCCGIALWHFSDVRTYSGGWSLKRPRAFNNKGTLDEYRRPKEAYAAVKAAFTKPDK